MEIFISHARSDDRFAETLRSSLVASGHQIWSADDLEPGENISLTVGRALERAEAMIVLLSAAAMESPGVQHEIEYALTRDRFSGRLVPVFLEPDVEAPWILRRLQGITSDDPGDVAAAVTRLLTETAA